MSLVIKDSILELEAEILKVDQVDLGTTHCIGGGFYARTIMVPGGVVLTGATHKKDSMCIVFGDITVTTDSGPVRMTGHNVFHSKAGNKRAGIAHVDTYWTNVWQTELTTIADIEDELAVESDKLQTRNNLVAFNSKREIEVTK